MSASGSPESGSRCGEPLAFDRGPVSGPRGAVSMSPDISPMTATKTKLALGVARGVLPSERACANLVAGGRWTGRGPLRALRAGNGEWGAGPRGLWQTLFAGRALAGRRRAVDERARRVQVAGIPQRVVGDAIETRNRNELHLANVDGFDGAKRSRSGFHSAERRRVSPPYAGWPGRRDDLPLPRRRTREKRRNWAHFGPLWRTGRNGHREQPKSWRTGLYGDATRLR